MLRKSKLKTGQWIAPFGFDFSSWSKCKCEWMVEKKKTPTARNNTRADGWWWFVCHSQISAVSINYIFSCRLFCGWAFFPLTHSLSLSPSQQFGNSQARSRQVLLPALPVCRCACCVCSHLAHIKSVRADGCEQETTEDSMCFSFFSPGSDSISRLSPLWDHKCGSSRRGDDKIFKCVNARRCERANEKKKNCVMIFFSSSVSSKS